MSQVTDILSANQLIPVSKITETAYLTLKFSYSGLKKYRNCLPEPKICLFMSQKSKKKIKKKVVQKKIFLIKKNFF